MYWLSVVLSIIFVHSRGGIGGIHVFDDASIFVQVLSTASQFTMFGQDIWCFFSYDTINNQFSFSPSITITRPPGPIGGFWFLQLPQGWSISTELMFYLLAPLIVFRSFSIIMLIITLAFLLRLAIYFVFGWSSDPWTYRFFPVEIGVFLLGTLSYHCYVYLQKFTFTKPVGLVILAVYLCLVSEWAFWQRPESFKQFFLVIFTSIAIPFVFTLTRNWKWDRLIGDLSYPIYLLHFVVFFGIIPLFMSVASKWASTVGLLVTVILSILLVRYLERPIDAWRNKLSFPANKNVE